MGSSGTDGNAKSHWPPRTPQTPPTYSQPSSALGCVQAAFCPFSKVPHQPQRCVISSCCSSCRLPNLSPVPSCNCLFWSPAPAHPRVTTPLLLPKGGGGTSTLFTAGCNPCLTAGLLCKPGKPSLLHSPTHVSRRKFLCRASYSPYFPSHSLGYV